MTALWFSCSRLVTSPALSWLLHATMCCPTSAASFFLGCWQNYLESEMSTMQTNKGPPGWCSWGVHSHANHHWFPFRTSICRAGVRVADMGPASFIPIKRVCSVRREWRLQGGVLTPCSCGYRSARAEADRPDPAQTDPHCSDHLHTGGGQTKRRQVNDKVGDRRGVSCDMWVGYAAHARG